MVQKQSSVYLPVASSLLLLSPLKLFKSISKRRLWWPFALLCLAMLISVLTQASMYDALAAYIRGDYVAAKREFFRLAMEGSPVAQMNMGLLYLKGRAVPRDSKKAFQWFKMAAHQGGSPGAI